MGVSAWTPEIIDAELDVRPAAPAPAPEPDPELDVEAAPVVDVDADVIDVDEVAPGQRVEVAPASPSRAAARERRRSAARPFGPAAGRIAIVSGACDVSRAIATALADSGARVLLIGADLEHHEHTAALARQDGTILTLRSDLASAAAVSDVAGFIERIGAGIDVLVHADGPANPARHETLEWRVRRAEAAAALTEGLLASLSSVAGHIVFVPPPPSPYDSERIRSADQPLDRVAEAVRAQVRATGVRVTSVHSEVGPDATAAVDPQDVADSVMAAVLAPARIELAEIYVNART